MLLHGIMSSIAEFYSQNLANEVKKGITEKVKGGGTVSRAPLGYNNIRRVDEKGREERTVVVDEERAPLIKLAFEEYATGNWTVADLAEHLAMCGLTSRATPKIPSTPIDKRTLNAILVNPYYKGIVTYKEVEYAGNHPALVDADTWQQVQDVLASHVNGERTREHPHFLKGSLYCRQCGARMIVTYAKSRSGVRYPYFICAGRHSKREKDCTQKAVLIDEIERQVEQIYERYSLSPELRKYLENYLQTNIKAERAKYETELNGLRREKEKLEHRRKKLLEAHYNDAIPLDLMKAEQQQIAKQLAAIEHQMKMYDQAFAGISDNVTKALEMIEDCGLTYRLVDDRFKKMLNQAVFSKLFVGEDGNVTAEFREPFNMLVEPFKGEIAHYNEEKARGTEVLTDIFSVIANRISHFFGHGLNNDLMVDDTGLEPVTSRTSSGCSTS